MKFRYVLWTGLVAIAAFIVGAFWAEEELWPYHEIAELERLITLKERFVRPTPVVRSAFTPLSVESFVVGAELSVERRGGGIYAFDDKVLIMGFRGEFILYQNLNGSKTVKRLNIDIDNAYQAFQDFVANNKQDTKKAAKEFRFLDVIFHRHGSPPALLVSHHQWHEKKKCYTVRLSRLDLKPGQPLETVSAEAGDWQKVYDTTPCLPMKTKSDSFRGTQSGGRIALEDSNSVLFTVGDHDFDGWNSVHIHAQDQSSDFGKIIRVDLSSGTAGLISVGHRNPQGLLIDQDGDIWSTEHGPQGGDELNIIRQDVNYGWPHVTYGSQYGWLRWPLSKNQNRHDGYARPIYAWIPSIGVSNVIQVKGFLPEWEGDLLVSSLAQRALHRIRYRDGRVIFDETIRVGLRVRDLDQLADGTIVLWADDTSITELKPIKAEVPSM